jgi:hypothetical protein
MFVWEFPTGSIRQLWFPINMEATAPVTGAVTTTSTEAPAAVISMQLKPRKPKRSVRWTEEVVDNEFMNKKKSKSTHLELEAFRWPTSSPIFLMRFFVRMRILTVWTHNRVFYGIVCCQFSKKRSFGDSGSESDCDSDEDHHHDHDHDCEHDHNHS